MLVQRIQNHDTQFKGKLTFTKYAPRGIDLFAPPKKEIFKIADTTEVADKELYDLFCKAFREEIKKFASIAGGCFVHQKDHINFFNKVKELLKINPELNAEFGKDGYRNCMFFYSTDGQGNLKYTLALDNDCSVIHELHVDELCLKNNKKQKQ